MWSKTNLIIGVLLVLLFAFWYYNYNSLKKEVTMLRNNNTVLKEQIINKDKAAQYRQEEYQKLEIQYNELNQQMEELNDKESVDWLSTNIPNNVDNTIPY